MTSLPDSGSRTDRPAPGSPASSSLGEEIGKRGPFDSLEEHVFLDLLRTADVLSTAVQRFLRDHDLSLPLYNALRIVAGAEDPRGIPTSAIGSRMVVREPDVTRLVDRLERCGLVERHRCAEDRRRILVRATKTGRAKAQDLRAPLQDVHRTLLGHFDEATLARLDDLLVEARRGAATRDRSRPGERGAATPGS